MASIALSFASRISPRSRTPASAAAARIDSRAEAGILSQDRLVMTVAPTRGAHFRSSMLGARPNHWETRAMRGVVSNALMSPVCRPGRISVEARGTGRKPAAFQRSTEWLSPAHTKSFIFLRSSGRLKGSLAKNMTQPASPQLRTTNPFSSRRFSSSGRTRSLTKSSSS
jgi:hypothetical protein